MSDITVAKTAVIEEPVSRNGNCAFVTDKNGVKTPFIEEPVSRNGKCAFVTDKNGVKTPFIEEEKIFEMKKKRFPFEKLYIRSSGRPSAHTPAKTPPGMLTRITAITSALLLFAFSAAVCAGTGWSAPVRTEVTAFAAETGDAGAAEEETGAVEDAGRLLPDGEVPDPSLRVGEDSDMPAWYPKDPAAFPFYHDENAPRVVDTADIFSDEEESRMESRLAEIRAQLGKDIVVFTDVSTYGLSHAVYAADFYDFNGYGIGDDREGACLMICMDPEDRGWWCCCTGPVTRGLYTEEAANQIDDLLYEYMRDGEYGPGVMDWIENFRRLYTTGSPYSEDWVLESPDTFQRFHDPDAPRIVDDAGILTGDEILSLEAEAGSVSEKYGVDVVVHTALNEGIVDMTTFADRFFLTHGYGLGEDYDGIQLTIFKRPGYKGRECVTASGSASDKLTDVNRSRLETRCDSLVYDGEYYEAARRWISQADHMLRTGRAPRSDASWMFVTILELLVGLIFGRISLGRAKAGMATPEIKENADACLVPGSLKIRNVQDAFLYATMDRVYSPPKEDRSSDDSSSGSSGHSSYSSSYSGSSGSSHSGSGRSF